MADIISYLKDTHNITFNGQQCEAVLSDYRHTLLLAVPGSGKTTVLVSRITNLMLNNNVKAENILTLTFSRESAKDMRGRFENLFSNIIETAPRFSTIHSFCFSVLKLYSQRYSRKMPTIISDSASKTSKNRILREINLEINEEYLSEDVLESLVNDISLAKNMMASERQIRSMDTSVENFYEVMQRYESTKKENSLMDYDDMLTFAYDLLQKIPSLLKHFQMQFPYINVDEAQDTSKLQYAILDLFSQSSKFFVVGDEDQCIYSFRGAYSQGLLEFGKHYSDAQVLKIEQNYRSNADIVKLANDFIKMNKIRYEKNMFCDNERTDSIFLMELSDYSKQYEAIEKIVSDECDCRIGILYRNNESAVPIIDMFRNNNTPYYIKEQNLRFFSSFVVRDIMAFFTLASDPKNIEAFEQIYYKCTCSKLIFLFVKYNIQSFETVFEAAANYPDISAFQRGKLVGFDKSLKALSSKTPESGIRWIENRLGYGDFIAKKVSVGLNPINSRLKLNILKTIAKNYATIESFIENMKELSMSMTAQKNAIEVGKLKPKVTLTTVHSAKGLEFDIVILVDFIDSILPSEEAINEAELGNKTLMESEARLFYVAITRARSRLVIFSSKYCNNEYVLRSRFITRCCSQAISSSERPRVNVDLKYLEGTVIEHNFFGIGIICYVKDNLAMVNFKDYGKKKIDYNLCVENGLIKTVE